MRNPQSPKSHDMLPVQSFELEEFFPYQVRTYYRAVSEAVTNIYEGRFNLRVSEWRTMAVIGPTKAMSASEIVDQSSMDKVAVSRAIKGLQARGFLERSTNRNDKRRAVLKLTSEGKSAFNQLVPLVKQVETDCLKGLTEMERQTLFSMMSKVQQNAESLVSNPINQKKEA